MGKVWVVQVRVDGYSGWLLEAAYTTEDLAERALRKLRTSFVDREFAVSELELDPA
jgi:hypothetical protein